MTPSPLRRTPTILVTIERSPLRDAYFPPPVLARLEALGDVRYNERDVPLTPTELAGLLPGVDACVTHWNCPSFTPAVLATADRLRLIAHAAGSIADLVTLAVFERGIVVTTANSAMAAHVAEGVLTYLLADLHRVPERAQLMREGGWLKPEDRATASLSGLTVGLVGLGMVGRRLIRLLAPFDVRVLVHDPFVSADEIAAFGAENVALDDLLRESDAVSLHASLTSATRGLLTRERLALIRDGALLLNTARAGLVDQEALTEALREGRIRAVLDVFGIEPLPSDSPLRSLPNATLMPHMAGSSSGADLAHLAVDEVGRMIRGEAPAHPVSFGKFQLMTREFDVV